MRYSHRKLLVASIAVVMSLLVAVGAAGAADRTDELFERIRGVYNLTNALHKDGVDLDKFVTSAIKGGLESLKDPHTNYYTEEEYSAFLSSLNGSFSGIGAYLDVDGSYVVISAPIKGTPAARAGLQSGDRVLEVDGVSLMGATTEKAVQLIRGTAGTPVTLKIERPSEERVMTVTVTRATIDIPEVDSKMLDNQIGYIQLTSFGDDVSAGFYKAVTELKSQGAKGLVLDLRQNPGGYVNAAVDIASAFVPAGEPVMWEVTRQGKESTKSYGRLINLPTAVLVDNGSASASEIVAGAVQDYGAAPLVGIKTYGKGTVQQFMGLEGGGGLKVTIAEYLTAKERHVHGIGLTPDYVVENPKPSTERTKPMQFTRFLTTGSVGLDVLYLQYRLEDLGYGPDVDGFFGRRTINAVEKFAHDNGLAEEPMVDAKFIEVLNRKVAAHSKTHQPEDAQLKKAVELVLEKLK